MQFQIEDTGKGIASQELDRIFDAFVQSNPTYQIEDGSGLGLAICQRFVHLMSGDIKIESTVGEGTKVKFYILAGSVEKPPQITQAQPLGQIIRLKPNQSNIRVLVVEDNLDNRQLLVQMLAPLGFDIIEATNGKEAVELWEKEQPNLILMDMRMPVMDGYQATKIIKQKILEKNNQNNTVIIALTATAFNQDRKFILKLGCDDFIRKPFQEDILLQKIAKYLNVEYIYDSNQNNTVSEHNLNLEQLKSEILEVMPEKWRKSLRTAALSCIQNKVIKLLKEIPQQHQTLKQQLENLADNYQFDIIAKLADYV